ncbi:hypothetical protein SH2C18_11040 [Clostridium sediminicola]|uniref:hypothetical protein n=1 Tax=Clostridium sediminicola TaxID=3114879 RepID=UPI0031F1DF23
MNKKLVISFLCTLIIILAVYLYLSPQNINKSYNAFIFSKNTDFTIKSVIKLNGTQHKRILSTNIINATITVDDYSYAIIFKQNHSGNYLGYIPENSKLLESSNIIGSIKLSHDLKQVWINSDDLNNKYKDIYYSTAPANNLSEAESIYKKLVISN